MEFMALRGFVGRTTHRAVMVKALKEMEILQLKRKSLRAEKVDSLNGSEVQTQISGGQRGIHTYSWKHYCFDLGVQTPFSSKLPIISTQPVCLPDTFPSNLKQLAESSFPPCICIAAEAYKTFWQNNYGACIDKQTMYSFPRMLYPFSVLLFKKNFWNFCLFAQRLCLGIVLRYFLLESWTDIKIAKFFNLFCEKRFTYSIDSGARHNVPIGSCQPGILAFWHPESRRPGRST